MRWAFAPLLLVALVPAAAQTEKPKGHWTTGETLFGWCLTDVEGMPENPLCVGFVSAVADVMGAGAAVSGQRACLRARLTVQHMVVAVKEYLKRRRDLVKTPAAALVARALAHEFPCK